MSPLVPREKRVFIQNVTAQMIKRTIVQLKIILILIATMTIWLIGFKRGA